MLEADRGGFASRAGGNWLAGVSLDWQVWKENENRARVAAARYAEERAAALRRRAESAVHLRVRQAHAEWQSARERVAVGAAAVEEAEESRRILQNRYENGLVTATGIIRGQTSLMAARWTRRPAFSQRTRRRCNDKIFKVACGRAIRLSAWRVWLARARGARIDAASRAARCSDRDAGAGASTVMGGRELLELVEGIVKL